MIEFTKENCKDMESCVQEMFDALAKSKKLEYIGHLNELLVFLAKAAEHAPQ